MKRHLPAIALVAILTLVAAACGDDGETASTGDTIPAGDPSPAAPADAFPATISSDAGEFTLDAPPERIVSLSPAATEILFAIGAGDQVVAVDEFSTFPAEAPTTDLSGFDPNVEAVTAFEPDLVVVTFDANDLVAGLTELGIPVLLQPSPSSIEDGYGDFAELGIATGRIDEAADAVAELRADIDAAFEAAPDTEVRIYHEIDQTFFSTTSSSFLGSIYSELGATNIADAADDGSGFPQLTEEYIIEADPELIVITDEVGYTPDDVAGRPGWDQITAVQNGNIVVVDADLASRWGPRLPQFIEAVADALAEVGANA